MIANWTDSAVTFRRCTASKITFILLNLCDLSLTTLAISLGLTELNPFVRLLMELPVLLITVKLAIPVLIAWIMPGKLLWPSIALLVAIVLWNIKELVVFFL